MAVRKELVVRFASLLKPKLSPQSQTLYRRTFFVWEKKNIGNCIVRGDPQFRSIRRYFDSPISGAKEKPPQTLIKAFTDCQEDKAIQVSWLKGSVHGLFPYVWLRDHCQCEECFHPISRSRTMLFKDLALDVFPVKIKLENNSVLQLEWSDGHSSKYDSVWLQERRFEKSVTVNKRPNAYKLPRVFWGSEILPNLPTANFEDLIRDDFALLSWLQQLEIYGFVLITNASAQQGMVRELAHRVSFVRQTHYGAEFCVRTKQDPSNVAYSSGPLQLHTDLPYYDYKPGAQLIHCIVQYEGEGAQSQVADGTHVARELKRIHPDKFHILATIPVDWCDIGTDEGRQFFKVLSRPVICLDSNGEIERINFSHPQRDSFFNIDFETVSTWYEAMKTFHNMLYDPQYCLEFKMKPGDIQSFDNLRIVHGRTAYANGSVEREIEGCYMDWDEIRSRRRVLERKLNLSPDSSCEHKHPSKTL